MLKRKLPAIIALLVAVLLVCVDRITKLLAVEQVKPEITVPVIKFGEREIINFTYLENTGAAFGILSGQQTLLIVITSLFFVLAVGILFSEKFNSKAMNASIALIIGGGVGNLIDRIIQGYVVDFIELRFMNFAIFNFADICVVLGAFVMCIAVIAEEIREHRAKKACAVADSARSRKEPQEPEEALSKEALDELKELFND
jgi:signal peptidase II